MALSPISTGWTGTDEFVRGLDWSVRVELERDGAALDIDSATVTVYKPDGTAVVTAGVADAVDNVATYEGLAAVMADDSPGDGWRVAWTIVTADETFKVQNPGSLVLYQVGLAATVTDLLVRHDDLRNLYADADRDAILSACLNEAALAVRTRLRQKGRRPYLVLSSFDFREYEILHALALAFRRCATGGTNTREWDQAADYDARAAAEWDGLTFEEADPATYASAGKRKSARSSFWLGSGSGRTDLRVLPSRIR